MALYQNNTTHKNSTLLDGIRYRNGAEGLKRAFHEIANGDRDKAVNLVNDPGVQFPSVFVLQPVLKKHDLYEHLNTRNRFSLDLSNEVLAGFPSGQYRRNEEDYPHLKWMLDTGYGSDGLNGQYDNVMDKVSLMLSRIYKDKMCMRPIVEMIFSRHRKGQYIYDLVWAFFESSTPRDLYLLADRLQSADPKDVELACRLLNFIPCLNGSNRYGQQGMYRCAHRWLRLNNNRLYYTGETTQQGSNPHRYAIVGSASAVTGRQCND